MAERWLKESGPENTRSLRAWQTAANALAHLLSHVSGDARFAAFTCLTQREARRVLVRAARETRDAYDLVVSTRLEAARLIIRTFQARDADPWLAMVSDPEVRRFLPAGPAPTMELTQRIVGERQAMRPPTGR